MKDQTQQLNTCLKLVIETLEQGVQYVGNEDGKAVMLFCSGVDSIEAQVFRKHLPVQSQQYRH